MTPLDQAIKRVEECIANADARGFSIATAPAADLRLVLEAVRGWRPIAEAKRDGTPVLALMRDDIFPGVRPGRRDLDPWNGRSVVVHHRGLAEDGWDPGWVINAPVGHGGFPDEWFVGWMPLPPAPQGDGL